MHIQVFLFAQRSLLLIGMVYLFSLSACQPEPGPPPNPFDLIDYGGDTTMTPKPDSASIVGIHTYILSQSCAVPGCHDGHFEPDYRTVQSSYSTLVYHPVVKNDTFGNYEFRVVPYDTDASWLYHRITTDDPILGRMPLYDNPLTAGQIKSVKDWIEAGAPDLFGKPFQYPNTHPFIITLAAFMDYNGFEVRVDTGDFRQDNVSNPFGVFNNVELTIWLGIGDDSTQISDLQGTRLMFSTEYDDFSNAVEIDASFSASPKMVMDYYRQGQAAELYWKVELNTGDFPNSQPIFFRLYTNDGNHSEDYEFPTNPLPLQFKTLFSFYIVP